MLFRHNTWVRHNETLLNSLKLIAWQGKGHAVMYQQDDGLPNNYILNFIDINNIKTRPIGREYNGMPLFEQSDIDSGMYDITLLKKSDKNLEDEFYYTCINRRTDPLIYNTDSIYWESPDTYDYGWIVNTGFKFYSTYEFDTFTQSDGNIINPEPNSGNTIDLRREAPYWRNLYWRRQGCREITVRFPVIDITKSMYYHVEEITDGTVFSGSLPWWKQEELKNKVDVIIPQGESLTSKFLPGAGKLYKVRIISTPNLHGELAYSNQTKMIAYPVNQTNNYNFIKVNDTLRFFKDDSMYYHVVYDRTDSITNKSRVYYRRSVNPYNRNINTKIISWGPEILISDTIVFTKIDHLPLMPPPLDSIISVAGVNISCKYPAIVVRYDEIDSIAKAYIVFGCTSPETPDAPRVFMVESVLPHNQIFFPGFYKGPNRLKPITFGLVNNINDSTVLDTWGAPSINASFNGNYYAWSDSILGVGVGFKTPNDRGMITNKLYLKHSVDARCIQPSLNTYSRIDINEENCALVYNERYLNFNSIVYTRIRLNGGQVENYVPQQYCDSDPLNRIGTYFPTNKAVIISNNYGLNGSNNYNYPVVHRPVDFARRPGFEYVDSMHYVGACWDRVYWVGDLAYNPNHKCILQKNIDIDDNNNCWYLLPKINLYSNDISLSQPSPSSGAPSSKIDGSFSEFALADSSFVLNFISHTLSTTPTTQNSTVHQLNFNAWINYYALWAPLTPNSGQIDVSQGLSNLGNGIYPHPTMTPVITINQDWFMHNRVFQSTSNIIKTSALLFLKGNTDEKAIYPLLSISDSTSKNNTLISQIYALGNSIEDRYKSIGLKAFEFSDKGRIKLSDTIVSDWFRINTIKELAFYTTIADTSLFTLTLEDYQNGKSLTMPLMKDFDSKMNARKITLLNGKNMLYRVKLTKKHKDVKTWVDLVLDEKKDLLDEYSELGSKDLKKGNSNVIGSNHQIYDLSQGELSSNQTIDLRIYPNPADEYIYVNCELFANKSQGELIQYTLYNSSGMKVYSSINPASDPIMISTDNLTTGAYFLKAEQLQFDNILETKPTITKSIIIQR